MASDISPDEIPSPACSDALSVCILASGSKGNSIYISDGSTSILFDAGLSGREIERRLQSNDISPESLDAIVVSHEHEDHVRGVGVLSRRYGLPVYISSKTFSAASPVVGNLYQVHHFQNGNALTINSLTLQPFYISHDAEDPSGFTIHKNDIKIGIATDLGIATTMVKEHLKKCRLLVLEANHDVEMLTKGPYPWHLKQRIKGRSGHLSNEDAAQLLRQIEHCDLEHVILAHLSEQNNTAEKALSEVGLPLQHSSAKLSVACQDHSSPVFCLKSP